VKTKAEVDQLIARAEEELARLNTERAKVIESLKNLRFERTQIDRPPDQLSLFSNSISLTNDSSEEAKITLFRSLFRGREDVYPRRFESAKTGRSGYQPACQNEWTRGICKKPKIICRDCDNKNYLPITDVVIRNHLMGIDPSATNTKDFTIGVYPLLVDETCWFLAADFDKDTWMEDVTAFLETCHTHNVPAVLERSRSGNGGHVWIFFSEPIPAYLARKLGSYILTRTMEHRPEIGLDSYDRFFPNQDTMPKGGFGNLIALPLQKKPRDRDNSVFVDENFEPYLDQWAFLSAVRQLNRQEVEVIVDEASMFGDFLGIRLVITDDENDEPWTAPPSRQRKEKLITIPLPDSISLVLGNQIYIAKEDIPPPLKNQLIRLAAFQNPEFYKAQAMRLSTFDKPRIIGCCEDFPNHIGVPRGCLEDVIELLQFHRIKPEIIDERFPGNPIDVQFQGILRPEQQEAADAMLSQDIGVLSATTGFGKTVIAAYMIAQRKTNTLVLVHRRQLLHQWITQLTSFLDLSASQIGQIGSGKRKPTGGIDIATIQSLSRKNVVDDIVGEYGYLIVDECHHVSAWSFENVVRQSKAKYVTGLSATVTRKDGHHPIIFMQCGSVRHRVDDRKQAEERPFNHKAIIRKTEFTLPEAIQDEERPSIHQIYSALVNDEKRNDMIVTDIMNAINDKRSPVVLTERIQHLTYLADRLSSKVQNVFVFQGGIGANKIRLLKEQLTDLPDDEERLILATGRYLGEGFDDARLDTLFLTLPISWRGTLTQYAGRLHRLHYLKKEVLVYDYVDFDVPVLARMFEKRRRGYKSIGYDIENV
jgi:superfamily II DNA or RNA helicase